MQHQGIALNTSGTRQLKLNAALVSQQVVLLKQLIHHLLAGNPFVLGNDQTVVRLGYEQQLA